MIVFVRFVKIGYELNTIYLSTEDSPTCETPMAPTYYGKILGTHCSKGLKKRLSEAILNHTRFDRINLAILAYIAAWRNSEKSI